MKAGEVGVLIGHGETLLVLDDHQVGDQIGGLVPAGKGGAGAWVQLLDETLSPQDLLLGNAHLLGNGVVLFAAQPLQVVENNFQSGAGLAPALQLQGQALGQIPGAHPSGVQALDQMKALLQGAQGQAGGLGQVLQLIPEIAVLIQAGT